MSVARPLGVYVHVPYCRYVCPYCDFNVYVAKRADWAGLGRSLVRELDARLPLFAGRTLHSLYFGGGTPSLAPVELLQSVMATVRAACARGELVDAINEVTLEVNPGSVGPEQLDAWRTVGVNRLSLGWQSTRPQVLRALGRDHGPDESRDLVRMAREAGFDNVSLDFIYAVPGQALTDLDADLDELLAAAPEHVSLYALTYHEGTELWRRRAAGRVTPIADELEAEMMEHIHERLEREGYERYEVSNYARPGRRAVHNALYWSGGEYLGAGPGAHSFVHDDWREGWRWESVPALERYLAVWGSPLLEQARRAAPTRLPEGHDPSVGFVEHLSARALAGERLMLAARTRDGIALTSESIAAHHATFTRALDEAVARGWATVEGGVFRPTRLGLRYADSLGALVV